MIHILKMLKRSFPCKIVQLSQSDLKTNYHYRQQMQVWRGYDVDRPDLKLMLRQSDIIHKSNSFVLRFTGDSQLLDASISIACTLHDDQFHRFQHMLNSRRIRWPVLSDLHADKQPCIKIIINPYVVSLDSSVSPFDSFDSGASAWLRASILELASLDPKSTIYNWSTFLLD
jgi:hypothetical protein